MLDGFPSCALSVRSVTVVKSQVRIMDRSSHDGRAVVASGKRATRCRLMSIAVLCGASEGTEYPVQQKDIPYCKACAEVRQILLKPLGRNQAGHIVSWFRHDPTADSLPFAI
jgi:hypothetical protein